MNTQNSGYLVDFHKLDEDEAQALIFNHIRGSRFEKYLLCLDNFKEKFPKMFIKQPTHQIFNYALNDMTVYEIELYLFYLENEVLEVEEKSWETKFFEVLQIPVEQRIPEPQNIINVNKRSQSQCNGFKESQNDYMETISKKNFVQQFVDDFNKNPRPIFDLTETDVKNASLKKESNHTSEVFSKKEMKI